MNKYDAVKEAIKLAATAIESCTLSAAPNNYMAEDVANFIETLASRLEKLSTSD